MQIKSIKMLKQAAEIKHVLSVCTLIPTLAVLYTWELKCMHSVCVLSCFRAFIAVPTNTENSNIFLICTCKYRIAGNFQKVKFSKTIFDGKFEKMFTKKAVPLPHRI